MTVCTYYFQGGLTFWSSLIISIILVGFFSLYLPFKKIKSKCKFTFIPLFIVLLLIGMGLNIGFFGMKDSCEGLWDRHFVKDYGREINTIEEAKEIFRDLAVEQFKNYLNQTQAQMQIEMSLNYTIRREDRYSISFGLDCYELHTNGELYTFWCGD